MPPSFVCGVCNNNKKNAAQTTREKIIKSDNEDQEQKDQLEVIQVSRKMMRSQNIGQRTEKRMMLCSAGFMVLYSSTRGTLFEATVPGRPESQKQQDDMNT
jgi:hypothetical protein